MLALNGHEFKFLSSVQLISCFIQYIFPNLWHFTSFILAMESECLLFLLKYTLNQWEPWLIWPFLWSVCSEPTAFSPYWGLYDKSVFIPGHLSNINHPHIQLTVKTSHLNLLAIGDTAVFIKASGCFSWVPKGINQTIRDTCKGKLATCMLMFLGDCKVLLPT